MMGGLACWGVVVVESWLLISYGLAGVIEGLCGCNRSPLDSFPPDPVVSSELSAGFVFGLQVNYRAVRGG